MKEEKKEVKKNRKYTPREKKTVFNFKTEENSEVIKQMYDFILAGYGRFEILKFFTDTTEFTPRSIFSAYESARKELVIKTSLETDDIITSHNAIYQEIMEYCKNENFNEGYMKAMALKEKLVGLHKEQTSIEINNETNIENEQSQREKYDFNKLEISERNRLNELFTKIEYDSKGIGNSTEKRSLQK